jgi:hypothetical protein
LLMSLGDARRSMFARDPRQFTNGRTATDWALSRNR